MRVVGRGGSRPPSVRHGEHIIVLRGRGVAWKPSGALTPARRSARRRRRRASALGVRRRRYHRAAPGRVGREHAPWYLTSGCRRRHQRRRRAMNSIGSMIRCVSPRPPVVFQLVRHCGRRSALVTRSFTTGGPDVAQQPLTPHRVFAQSHARVGVEPVDLLSDLCLRRATTEVAFRGLVEVGGDHLHHVAFRRCPVRVPRTWRAYRRPTILCRSFVGLRLEARARRSDDARHDAPRSSRVGGVAATSAGSARPSSSARRRRPPRWKLDVEVQRSPKRWKVTAPPRRARVAGREMTAVRESQRRSSSEGARHQGERGGRAPAPVAARRARSAPTAAAAEPPAAPGSVRCAAVALHPATTARRAHPAQLHEDTNGSCPQPAPCPCKAVRQHPTSSRYARETPPHVPAAAANNRSAPLRR